MVLARMAGWKPREAAVAFTESVHDARRVLRTSLYMALESVVFMASMHGSYKPVYVACSRNSWPAMPAWQ